MIGVIFIYIKIKIAGEDIKNWVSEKETEVKSIVPDINIASGFEISVSKIGNQISKFADVVEKTTKYSCAFAVCLDLKLRCLFNHSKTQQLF